MERMQLRQLITAMVLVCMVLLVPTMSHALKLSETMAVDNATITGTVTAGPDCEDPLEGIYVGVYLWTGESWAWVDTGYVATAADGTYAFGGLAAGTYKVEFYDEDGNYFLEYYDNQTDFDSATEIPLGAGETKGNINACLEVLPMITGTVTTGPDCEEPLEDILVYAVHWNGEYEYWEWVDYVFTASDGTYEIGGLQAGTYKVEFYDEDGNYFAEYYDNQTDFDSATEIPLGAGEIKEGINACLEVSAKITGTVVGGAECEEPLREVFVTLYQIHDDSVDFHSFNFTNADGTYKFGGLQAGTYKVSYEVGGYLYEFYDNQTDFDSATEIPLGAGETREGINGCFEDASKITGTVFGPDCEEPLDNILVEVNGDNGYGEASTYFDGTYELVLPAGTYKVRFRDRDDNYFAEYYDNQKYWDFANEIVLGAGLTVGDIEACLEEDFPAECEEDGDCGEDQTCDETFNRCVGAYDCAVAADCNDRLHCTGVETCVEGKCVDGTYPCAADETCDEKNDKCVDTPFCSSDKDCADPLYCNGVERCVQGICVDGTSPCKAEQTCDERTDKCLDECISNKDCVDLLYCNGVETCVKGVCVDGKSPCAADQTCDEKNDICVDKPECTVNADCADDLLCNGVETCVKGACVDGKSPCAADQTCDEKNDICVDTPECASDADCADNLFCNGVATCVEGACVDGKSPCAADQTCDEENDNCVDALCTLYIKYKPPVAAKLKKDKKVSLKIMGSEGFDPRGAIDLGPFQPLKPKVNAKKGFVNVGALVPVGTEPGTYKIYVGDCLGVIQVW